MQRILEKKQRILGKKQRILVYVADLNYVPNGICMRFINLFPLVFLMQRILEKKQRILGGKVVETTFF